MKILQDFPDYAAAATRLSELKGELSAAHNEHAVALAAINGAAKRQSALTDQATAYMDSGEALPGRTPGDREALRKSSDHIRLLNEAVRIQRGLEDQARAAASKIICDTARPEFVRLVMAELRAAHALLTAQAARRDCWQNLDASGVSMATLPPVAGLVKGDMAEPSHMFWQRVADAERLGYIKAGEFSPPQPKPERMGVGLHIAAGPAGIQEMHVDANNKLTKGPLKVLAKTGGW